jgi:hypothetical protein
MYYREISTWEKYCRNGTETRKSYTQSQHEISSETHSWVVEPFSDYVGDTATKSRKNELWISKDVEGSFRNLLYIIVSPFTWGVDENHGNTSA